MNRPLSLLASLLALACNSPVDPGDGGLQLPDVSAPDAGIDAAIVSTRYGACTSSAECPDSAPECNITYPGGMCTQRCQADADCAGDGVCWGGTCSPTCTLGDDDCHAGYCLHTATSDFCVAACYSERARPTDWPSCVGGYVCDPWESFCGPSALPHPAGGTGAPCASNNQCSSGTCLIYDTWLDGYCISYGRQVASSAFVIGQPLPQSSCPDDAIVMPSDYLSLTSAEGDWIYCMKACTADSDCRQGYECMGLQDEGDGRTYTVGGCTPTDDCMNPAHACPTGHTCMGSATFAHCY